MKITTIAKIIKLNEILLVHSEKRYEIAVCKLHTLKTEAKRLKGMLAKAALCDAIIAANEQVNNCYNESIRITTRIIISKEQLV